MKKAKIGWDGEILISFACTQGIARSWESRTLV
jgi:hypothetical protein